jgi:hypothetical protein
VDNVHSSLNGPVRHFVFGGQHQQSDRGRIEHFGQARNIGHSSDRHAIELVPGQAKPVLHKILQLSPQK